MSHSISRRILAGALALSAAFAGGAYANAATRSTLPRSVYVLRHTNVTTHSVPSRIVLRGCVAEDDFGAGFRLIDYSPDRVILRCRQH
jgi:hypothetical protein